MGISYTAVKTSVPQAWDIGKDYYGLTDLFPACAASMFEGGISGLIERVSRPSIKSLPNLVGSRHIVGNAVFAVTDYYATADEMIAKIIELKQRPLDMMTEKNLRGFFDWAGSDKLQLIGEVYDLTAREAEDEYELCAPPIQYIVVNEWNGEANRPMVEQFDEEEE